MRPKAREMLAQRQLEARERPERDREPQKHRSAAGGVQKPRDAEAEGNRHKQLR